MRSLRLPFILPATESAMDASQESTLLEEDLHELTTEDQRRGHEKASHDRDGGC